MNNVQRLFMMITNINLFLIIIFFNNANEVITDFFRANCLIILFMISALWVSGKMTEIYDGMFNSLVPFTIDYRFKYMICIMVDILVHILPVLIMGLPKRNFSFVCSILFIICWYVLVYENLDDIYLPIIKEYSYNIFLYTLLCVIFYIILQQQDRKSVV